MAPPARKSVRRAVIYGLPFASLLIAVLLRRDVGPFASEGIEWEIAIPALSIALLIPTVLVSLRHADAAADRLGEPLGTLLLTLAVTTIEVSLISFVMLHGENNPTLARESVFSVVMIVTSGGIGLCLTLGALRYGEQEHRLQGTSAYLAVLVALSVLLLILPNFTTTSAPGTYSRGQLVFVSAISLLLYLGFLYIQSVRHREFFLDAVEKEEIRAVSRKTPYYVTLPCMLAGLLAVVLLGERVAAGVEDGLAALRVPRPDAIIGALIALLLLFPEMLAAMRASRRNLLQRSINIILGSALATIGLTIPAIVAVSFATHRELVLGLAGRDEILLVLAFTLSIISFGTGRTNVLNGFVHLVVFLTYLMLLLIP
ncbi:MAG TPA: ionic transporter y4hA [Rhodanobacteraceae bacterium]|jgi:Ca2+:H+ antiporter|nr:ionic transporter y4hA [Rhodanobacteraceae bacterium]